MNEAKWSGNSARVGYAVISEGFWRCGGNAAMRRRHDKQI